MTVAVALADRSVLAVDEMLDLVAPCPIAAGSLRFGFAVKPAGQRPLGALLAGPCIRRRCGPEHAHHCPAASTPARALCRVGGPAPAHAPSLGRPHRRRTRARDLEPARRPLTSRRPSITRKPSAIATRQSLPPGQSISRYGAESRLRVAVELSPGLDRVAREVVPRVTESIGIREQRAAGARGR
jgi:hypothetical protein